MIFDAREHKVRNLIWIPLKHGDDLLNEITAFCQKNDSTSGFISVIGALQEAKLGYYNQKEKQYKEIVLNKPLEIASCAGNISLKDNKPFLHSHIVLSDEQGQTFGGHLNQGCKVFAAECALYHLEGNPLIRELDNTTGLHLWNFKK